MKFKSFAGLALLIFVFASRRDKIKLIEQPRTNLSFKGLPEKVQDAYLAFAKYETSLNVFGKVDTVINLSSKRIDHSTRHFSSIITEYVFTIEDQEFILPYESDARGPYVFIAEELYFKVTRNATTEEEITEAAFGKFNLEGILKK